MSGYHDSAPSSGLLGHSVKLAAAVIVVGLAVVFLIDRGGVMPAAPKASTPAQASTRAMPSISPSSTA